MELVVCRTIIDSFTIFLFTETDLLSKIDELSEEKNLQSQKISQLEQVIQSSSMLLLLFDTYFKCLNI